MFEFNTKRIFEFNMLKFFLAYKSFKIRFHAHFVGFNFGKHFSV